MPSLLRNHTPETGCQRAQGSSWHSDSWYTYIFNRGAGADQLTGQTSAHHTPRFLSFMLYPTGPLPAIPKCILTPNDGPPQSTTGSGFLFGAGVLRIGFYPSTHSPITIMCCEYPPVLTGYDCHHY